MSQPEDLSVAEAASRILAAVHPLAAEEIPLLEGLNRIVAAPIIAANHLPPFTNSAMDGYAGQAADIATAAPDQPIYLTVIGEIAAGEATPQPIHQGTAVRIMTGAPLPKGADVIIPVEQTDEAWRDAHRPLPEKIGIKQAVTAGSYIRHQGEDIATGTAVLHGGERIRPATISLLASLGVSQVTVVRRPRIGILATGDELLEIDEALQPGKIRNSNSYGLSAQVSDAGGVPILLGIAKDTTTAVREKLQVGLEMGVDMFISTAGVSVGVYDVVTAVLKEAGNVAFWRVRMRPGKPLAFGHYGGVPYFGLPGNPVSSLVSFERFARPAIRKMGGESRWHRPQKLVTLLEPLRSDGRESYVRGLVERSETGEYTAVLSGGQGSHIVSAMVHANALIIIPEGVTAVATGTQLPAIMLDWPETVF